MVMKRVDQQRASPAGTGPKWGLTSAGKLAIKKEN